MAGDTVPMSLCDGIGSRSHCDDTDLPILDTAQCRMQMRLIAELLSWQDPNRPHTILTRIIITLIIVAANVIYAGFFGVLAFVAVYLLGVELMGLELIWALAPFYLSLPFGLWVSFRSLAEYWQNYGHG